MRKFAIIALCIVILVILVSQAPGASFAFLIPLQFCIFGAILAPRICRRQAEMFVLPAAPTLSSASDRAPPTLV